MINSIFQSTTIPLLEQVAAFTERRQEILAGNMANINTDDYRMRDLDVEKFQAILRQAIGQRHQPPKSKDQYAMPPFPSPGFSQSASAAQQPDIASLFTPELFKAVEAPPENLTFQQSQHRRRNDGDDQKRDAAKLCRGVYQRPNDVVATRHFRTRLTPV